MTDLYMVTLALVLWGAGVVLARASHRNATRARSFVRHARPNPDWQAHR